jgi:3-deoxy-D-manno-octulosonic-acid transferase
MTGLWHASTRSLYATALRLGLPLYLLRQWQRGWTEPGYREHLGERLGYYAADGQAAPGGVWLHAASLSETRAAAALVQSLRDQYPGMALLLTHGTPSGRQAGSRLLRPGDWQAWLPYDTPGAVRRFLKQHRPAVGVLVECDPPPVLLHEARRAGVPMVLANARSPDRLPRRSGRLAAAPSLSSLQLVLAQSVPDAQALRAAGARQVVVCGDLGTDHTPNPRLLARGLSWRQAITRPVVLLAGSREREEAELLAAWRHCPAPRPLLVLVPRHRQRADEVADLAQSQGLRLVRRSSWGDAPAEALAAQHADAWLGDTSDAMALYYGCADVALMGGSFVPLGGSNPVEAAACGCPVVMGPNTFRHAGAARRAEQAVAALRVANLAEAVAAAVELAASPRRNEWVRNALAFAQAHRGAAALMARHVLQHQQQLPGAAAN